MKRQLGLTLVELLVVISVLGIAGVLILNIFTATLKGSNKTQVIGAIKQNGQAVLEVMDKTIRNSDNVVCPFFLSPTDTASYSNTLVTVKNGIYTRYRLIVPGNTNTASGNNCGSTSGTGCLVYDNPIKQIIEATQIEETDPQFVDRICNAGSQMLSNAVILTDTNPQTGVSINCVANDCSVSTNYIFTRSRSFGFKDQVTIQFVAKPGVGVAQSVAGQIDPVLFQTTISLR